MSSKLYNTCKRTFTTIKYTKTHEYIKFNSNISKRIDLKKFYINEKLINKNDFFKTKSPVRLICNTFWQSINWKEVNQNLKNDLRILEVGCGTGRYFEFLKI